MIGLLFSYIFVVAGIFDDVLSKEVPRKPRVSTDMSPCHSAQSSEGGSTADLTRTMARHKLPSTASSGDDSVCQSPTTTASSELCTVQEKKVCKDLVAPHAGPLVTLELSYLHAVSGAFYSAVIINAFLLLILGRVDFGAEEEAERFEAGPGLSAARDRRQQRDRFQGTKQLIHVQHNSY